MKTLIAILLLFMIYFSLKFYIGIMDRKYITEQKHILNSEMVKMNIELDKKYGRD